ncbi:MAG: hypothetical protein PHD33_02150 [Atribacterota bacterium]|nr:hypothetical protein [Atribacterota bacterium]
MSMSTGQLYIPIAGKNSITILGGLLNCWHTLGLTLFLQVNNLLPLMANNRHPHSFGIIIWLCLYLGIQSIFIHLRILV